MRVRVQGSSLEARGHYTILSGQARTWLVSCLPAAPEIPWPFSAWLIMASRFAAMRCFLSDISRQYVPVGLPTRGPQDYMRVVGRTGACWFVL